MYCIYFFYGDVDVFSDFFVVSFLEFGEDGGGGDSVVAEFGVDDYEDFDVVVCVLDDLELLDFVCVEFVHEFSGDSCDCGGGDDFSVWEDDGVCFSSSYSSDEVCGDAAGAVGGEGDDVVVHAGVAYDGCSSAVEFGDDDVAGVSVLDVVSVFVHEFEVDEVGVDVVASFVAFECDGSCFG